MSVPFDIGAEGVFGILMVLGGIFLGGLFLVSVVMKGAGKAVDSMAESKWEKISDSDRLGKQNIAAGDSVSSGWPSNMLARDGRLYTFSDAQLQVYGTKQVRTLETILERMEQGNIEIDKPDEIVATIRQKINWSSEGNRIDAEWFLRDFHAALQDYLLRAEGGIALVPDGDGGGLSQADS